nr:DUF4917 family protein [Legionella sp. MW5194]
MKEQKKKIGSIENSAYLNTVYNNAFNDIDESITIYGWNFNDNDDHVLERIKRRKWESKKLERIAVFRDGKENEFIDKVEKKLNKFIGKNVVIEFYDAGSKDAWNN